MGNKDIRNSFLSFFKRNGHTIVPSDSLVPSSDPTLLFTSAGMVQFKAHFLQQIPLTFTRATSSQRCIRTTDIEQVGLTARHLTMFEMLGNFSFGDYFKEKAIVWAWEFLTKDLQLSEKRLWITIYKDDDEAEKIWKKIVPARKIVRLGEDTNFWTMGPTGPCGPCSEIHWDFIGDENTSGPDDSDRWMEVWNLVFTQFDRQENGDLKPLPKKNIDTGMGLERLTSVVESTAGNFGTSLFAPVIQFGEQTFHYKMGSNLRKDIALKIVADHLRAVTLLVFDGILPSNEGRGYVLRRLLRRAVRQGSLFGLKEPFLHKGVSLICDLFKQTADDLPEKAARISEIVQQEELRFIETIDKGSEKLKEIIDLHSSKKGSIPGVDVFRLYDTFGFPPELTKEILSEHGLAFDFKEFETAKEQAQSLARDAWKGSGAQDVTIYNDVLKTVGASQFKGYDSLSCSGAILAIVKDGKTVQALSKGESGDVVTLRTPFYPEGGGQVGDIGWIRNGQEIVGSVVDTQKPLPTLIVHRIDAKTNLSVGQMVDWVVDPNHRDPTRRHHTATHLLHAALRKVLGSTVSQAGSLVAPDRLRFDFTFNRALTPNEIRQVEDIVNDIILKNWDVTPKTTTPDAARKMGAMALFGEKYGSEVRCLIVGEKGFDAPQEAFSLELCGGTHVSASGDIGSFKIIGDSSLAAGVRRIEAVAGTKTIDYLRTLESITNGASSQLKTGPSELESRVRKLVERQRELETQVGQLKLSLAQGVGGGQSNSDVVVIDGINLSMKMSDGLDVKNLRVLADRLKDQIKSGVVFVATSVEDEGKEKVSFIFALTPDAQAKGLNAGQLAKFVATELGGSGGGRVDFAQGGGQSKEKLKSVMAKIPEALKASLKK